MSGLETEVGIAHLDPDGQLVTCSRGEDTGSVVTHRLYTHTNTHPVTDLGVHCAYCVLYAWVARLFCERPHDVV